jgi:hypothetical protein
MAEAVAPELRPMRYLEETTNNILRNLIMEAQKDENPFDNPPDPDDPTRPMIPDDDGYFPDGTHETLPDAVPGQGPWRPDIDPGNVNPVGPGPVHPFPHNQYPYFENPFEVEQYKPGVFDPNDLDAQNINNPTWQPGTDPYGEQLVFPWDPGTREVFDDDFGTPIDDVNAPGDRPVPPPSGSPLDKGKQRFFPFHTPEQDYFDDLWRRARQLIPWV